MLIFSGSAFRLLNDAEIAKSKRDFELKKAAYDVEVQTKVIGAGSFSRPHFEILSLIGGCFFVIKF